MNLATHSIRTLLRQPRYTILATLTLAVGIGVPAGMFGLLDAVYFRPLPLNDPDRLVEISLEGAVSRFGTLSYEEFRDIERHAPAFQQVFAIGQRGVTLTHQGDVQQLLIHYVSGEYFPSLGLPMHLGRGFNPADDTAQSATPQAVINYHVWSERLGAPQDIIGRIIQLNNTAFTVIGVTARGFAGLRRIVRTDVWVTTAQAHFVVPGLREEIQDPRQRWFRLMARLDDGADIAQARAGLDVMADRWRRNDPTEYRDARLAVHGQDETTRRLTQQGATVLALVSLILLIACANVANLTLARGEARRREVAVRAALGATRSVLVRQLLFESASVAAVGAAGGLLLASWLMALVPALLPPGSTALVLDLRADARLITFTTALFVLATLLVGLVPAWRGSSATITTALRGEGAQPAGGRVLQLRDVLVIAEVALSCLIIIAAGLVVRSFANSLAINPGFSTSARVATFYLVPGLKGYDRGATYRLFEEARNAASGVPGVTGVSYGIRLPAQGNEAGWAMNVSIPGSQPPAGQDGFEIRYTMVGPDYFGVVGTRVLQGRGIVATDGPNSPQVSVISESMARRFWPGASPIGQRIRTGRTEPVEREIVGVAEDIRVGSLYEAPEMYFYVPYAQVQQQFGMLFVKTATDPKSVIAPVKAQLGRLAPDVPVLAVSSVAEHMDRLLYEDRRDAWIGLALACLALTLGGVGIYGVVSLVTARRARELGIRVALGAERTQLLRLLLGKAIVLALVGAALGVAGGLVAGRQLHERLHGVDPHDPLIFAGGTLLVVLAALAASVVPAWRGARVDPVIALRADA